MNVNFLMKIFVLLNIQNIYHSSSLESECDKFSTWEDISNFVASPTRFIFDNNQKIDFGPTIRRQIVFGEDNKPSLIQDGVWDNSFSENNENIGIHGLLDEPTAKCVTKSETNNELFPSRSGVNCTIKKVLDVYPKNVPVNLEIPFDDEATDYDISPLVSTYSYVDPLSNKYKFRKKYATVMEANDLEEDKTSKNIRFSSDLPPLIQNKIRRDKNSELEINKKESSKTKSAVAAHENIRKSSVGEKNTNFLDSLPEIISFRLPKREKHERNAELSRRAYGTTESKMKITAFSEWEHIIQSSQKEKNVLFSGPPESRSPRPLKNEKYEENKSEKLEKRVTGTLEKIPTEKINKKKKTAVWKVVSEDKNINKSTKSKKFDFQNSPKELPTFIQFGSFETGKRLRQLNISEDKMKTASSKIKRKVNRGLKVDEINFKDSAVDINAKAYKNNKNTKKKNAKEIEIPHVSLLKTEKYEINNKAKKATSSKIKNIPAECDNIYYSKNYKNDRSDKSRCESDAYINDANLKRDSKLKITNSKSGSSINKDRKILLKNENESFGDYEIIQPKSRGYNSTDYSTAKEFKWRKKVVGHQSPYESDDSEEEITSKGNTKFQKIYVFENPQKDVKSKSEKSANNSREGKKIKNDAVRETAYVTQLPTPKSIAKKNDTSSKTQKLLSNQCFQMPSKTKNIIKKIKESILKGKTEDDFKLTRIVVMFRHGIRAPGIIRSFTDTTHIYWENQRGFRNGPDGPQLTQRGLDMMYDLGVRIKRRYPNLLRIPEGTIFPRSVRAYSTPCQRTMDSMKATLTGIYLPLDYPQIIITDSYPLFNCRQCPQYLLELGNIRRNGYDNPYERKLADIFSKHSESKNIGTDGVFSIVDTILCEVAMEIDQPEWIKELLDNKDIFFYRHYRWAASSWTDKMKRLGVGAWLAILIQPIRDTISGKKSSEVHLHALHDNLIHNIITTLKPTNSLFNVFDVYFGASLTIEIWRDLTFSKPLYYLKVLFSSSTLLNNFIALKLPFCQVPTMCTADEFIAGVEKYIPDDLEKECSI